MFMEKWKSMVRKNITIIVLMVALVLMIGAGMLVKVGLEKAEVEAILTKFPDRGIPRINLTLEGVSLEEINTGSKEVKYEGNKLSLYGGSDEREFSGVQVKGRGNGTWEREKKPYQIKFSEKVDLFGMGKAKKWVLLANAMDATNLRTKAAFYLEEMLGMKYQLRGEFVELYVNEEYEGLYFLTHAMEIGKNAVDLRDPMGVLVELDNLYFKGENYRESGKGDYLVLKDTVSDGDGETAMKEFMLKYDEFERAVEEKNYEKVTEFVDIESFAQYYLLSEFSVNPDAYWTSFYMYKDGVGDKIHAGPGWDFDFAFANRWWGNWMGEEFYSPDRTMIRRGEILSLEMYEAMGLDNPNERYESGERISRIIFDMMEMPEFRAEVEKQYQEKMGGKMGELADNITEWADDIGWPIWEDYQRWNRGNYLEDIEMMTQWIKDRGVFFEQEYGGACS